MASDQQPQKQKTSKKNCKLTKPPPPTTTSQQQSTTSVTSSTTSTLPSSTTVTSLTTATVATRMKSSTTSTLPSSTTATVATRMTSSTLPSSIPTTFTHVTSPASTTLPPSTTVATMMTSSTIPSSSSTTFSLMTSSSSSSSTTATLPSTPTLPSTSTTVTAAGPSSSTTVTAASPSSSTAATAAVSVEWGECQWAIKAWPRGAIIPSSPGYIFCQLHDDLSHVVPRDDIYAQPPSRLLINRRANLPNDQTYALHCPRYLNDDKKKTARRSVTNSSAVWKSRGKSQIVAGKDANPAGLMCPLVLKYKKKGADDNKPPPLKWEADEYISYGCKDGKSAIVVVRCLNSEWREAEMAVIKAQGDIEMAHRRHFSFKDKLTDPYLQADYWKDVAAQVYQAQLNAAIAHLQNERGKLLVEETDWCEYKVQEQEVFDQQPRVRVTGGIRIQEPSSSDPVPRNDLGLVREESEGNDVRYFDTRISRRDADRLRRAEKGKEEKMVEKGNEKRK